jgi:hypothetical protein
MAATIAAIAADRSRETSEGVRSDPGALFAGGVAVVAIRYGNSTMVVEVAVSSN